MKFKCLLAVLCILLIPFTACAKDITDGSSVKKMDSEGNIISIGGEIKEKENTTVQNVETSPDSSTKAGEAMIENAIWNVAWGAGDQFLESGFKINSIGVEEKAVTGAKSFTYSVYSKEINPLKSETVRSILIPSIVFYAACMVILGSLAYIIYCAQSSAPKLVSKIRMGISGDEGFFDIEDVFTVWGSLIAGPIGTYAVINFAMNARNLLVMSMATSIVNTIAASSDSLPSYLLACISWYFSGLQRLIAYFGIYFFVATFLGLWVLVILIYLFASLEKAALVAGFSILEFVLCVLVDIVIVFLVWFGTHLIAETGIQEIGIATMIIAFVVALVLLVVVPIILFFKVTKNGKIGTVGY
jgi:hypothetical protein